VTVEDLGASAATEASPACRRLALSAIVAASIAVAVGVLVSKHAVETLPALPVVFVQVLASTMFSLIVAAMLGRLPRGRTWRLGWPGILQPGLAYMLTFAGLALMPVSVGRLLFAFENVLVVLLAWPLLGERPSYLTMASAVLATLGVVLISQGPTPEDGVSLAGVLLTLAGVTAAALDTVATRRLAETADPLTMTVAVQAAAVVTVGLSGPFWPLAELPPLASPGVLGPIVLSGILIHAVATPLFIFGLHYVKAGVAATVFPLISLLTALGGLVFFAEPLSAWQAAGGGLIVGASLATAWCVSRGLATSAQTTPSRSTPAT
jgi:probable blue pigment (indigoidine) exporter